MKNIKLTKQLSSRVILIVALISYLLKFIIGGIIGDGLVLLALICLIFGLMQWYRETKARKTIPIISSDSPPKTDFQNYLLIPHIESLLNHFINHEKQISLVTSDCAITLFEHGYIPVSEEFNNPQRMVTVDPSIKINSPTKWLLLRLWLDLINFKNLAEKTNGSLDNIFTDYLNNLGPKMDQSLIIVGSLSQKYGMNELEKNWSDEIKKISNTEDFESFKANYIADILLPAEVRILAWIYKELFNKEFKFKK